VRQHISSGSPPEPTTGFIAVQRFLDQRWLVEFEVDAVLDG
jgi:hypothetical protein